MTLIQDILDVDALTKHICNGDITERFHPEFPELVIYNYSDKVAFSGVWTHETRTCRGLIVNLDTQEVLARPFAKFFNYGQEKIDYDLDTPVWALTNKEDGSLGIGYVRPDGLSAIATRGSFVSTQALHATFNLTQENDSSIQKTSGQGYTQLFEIVYPDNRIVLDYGDRDELILIGFVATDDGRYIPVDVDAFVARTTLRDVLAMPMRENAEGWVIWLNGHTALKLKQQDYVELHRIVTGLNRKSVWRALSEGNDVYYDMLEALPDELYGWASAVGNELINEYAQIMRWVDARYVELLEFAEDENITERRDLAEWVKDNVAREYVGLVFSTLDGRDIQGKIWKMIEPIGGGK